ncbi:MAG: hypothetical protein V3W41_06935 [Planctomycetota bacterium]
MKTLLIYILVAFGSGLMAWTLFHDAVSPNSGATGAKVSKLDDPLFYLDISSTERLERARLRLDVMANTSIAATSTGSVKDELALLCRDEAVVDLIVDDFHQRRKADAPLSSFMEIFARKKHPKFAPLVRYGLLSRNYEAISNAKRAVFTQRHSNVVVPLLTLLDKSEEGSDRSVVDALIALGNDEAFDALRLRLTRFDRECLLSAMPALANRKLKEAIPQFRALRNHENVDVRVLAAWACASLGLSEGIRNLKDDVADESLKETSRAQALHYLYLATGLDSLLIYDRWARGDLPNLGFEALVSLLKCGHEDGRRRVMRDLAGDDLVRRSQALSVLGRIGDLGALREMRLNWRRYHANELGAFMAGLSQAGIVEALPLLRDLYLAGEPYRFIAERNFESYGHLAVPYLAEIAEKVKDTSSWQRLVAILASIHHQDSRALLESLPPRQKRGDLIFQRMALRQLDLGLAKLS